jgi:hypothetical protein
MAPQFREGKAAPGGKLLLLDLAGPSSVADYIIWGFAAIPNMLMNFKKTASADTQSTRCGCMEKAREHDHY